MNQINLDLHDVTKTHVNELTKKIDALYGRALQRQIEFFNACLSREGRHSTSLEDFAVLLRDDPSDPRLPSMVENVTAVLTAPENADILSLCHGYKVTLQHTFRGLTATASIRLDPEPFSEPFSMTYDTLPSSFRE